MGNKSRKALKHAVALVLMASFLTTLSVFPALGAVPGPDTTLSLAHAITPFLNQRAPLITVSYAGPIDSLFDHLSDLVPQAIGFDDYLQYNMDSWRVSASGYPGDVTVTLAVRYLTTEEQEQELEHALVEALPEILAGADSPAKKIRAIHDAISERVRYDSALREYSAYAGWVMGLTVCQGYSLLADRLLGMAGIPSRILAGTLDGGAHAWNLVKLDGEWLHMDVTNDDASRSDRYYLVKDDVLQQEGFVFDPVLRERLIREAETESALSDVPMPLASSPAISPPDTCLSKENFPALRTGTRKTSALIQALLTNHRDARAEESKPAVTLAENKRTQITLRMAKATVVPVRNPGLENEWFKRLGTLEKTFHGMIRHR